MVGVALNLTSELFALSGAYPVLWLARHRFQLPSIRRFGDPSFGMYLYGWPIEQTWRAVIGPGVGSLGLFALSLPVAAVLGYASWHLIEKRALSFKPKFRARRLAQPASEASS